MYAEDEMLMLSGIQHYCYCPRQWALIHIEQQWADNVLTTEGTLMHERVDDPFYRQKCGDNICLRSVSIASKSLGLYGLTDVVELLPADEKVDSITHPKYPGYWKPQPVEYKHGRPKSDHVDEVQLAAQAMCLEEMYSIRIERGVLYYGQTKRRVEVDISDSLRGIVVESAAAMHRIFDSGVTPSPTTNAVRCRRCSLKDLCMPEVFDCNKASYYLKKNLIDEKTS